MNVACPRCRQALEVDDRRARRPVKCPVCRHVFNVPTTPLTPRKSRGLRWRISLLLLVFLATGGFGGAMLRYHESPAQVWARVTAFIDVLRRPVSDRAPVPATTPPSTTMGGVAALAERWNADLPSQALHCRAAIVSLR